MVTYFLFVHYFLTSRFTSVFYDSFRIQYNVIDSFIPWCSLPFVCLSTMFLACQGRKKTTHTLHGRWGSYCLSIEKFLNICSVFPCILILLIRAQKFNIEMIVSLQNKYNLSKNHMKKNKGRSGKAGEIGGRHGKWIIAD